MSEISILCRYNETNQRTTIAIGIPTIREIITKMAQIVLYMSVYITVIDINSAFHFY